MSSRARFRCAALVLAAAALGVRAAPPAEEPKTPIEAMKRDLFGMQGHLQSMKMRIKHPMSGTGESKDGRAPTPAESCCAGNIEHVNSRVQSLNQSIEALYVHYTERNDEEGRAALDDVRNELNIVARGVAIFKMAGTIANAEQALAGVIWPFNRLREAIDHLGVCCPVDGPLPSGSKPPSPR